MEMWYLERRVSIGGNYKKPIPKKTHVHPYPFTSENIIAKNSDFWSIYVLWHYLFFFHSTMFTDCIDEPFDCLSQNLPYIFTTPFMRFTYTHQDSLSLTP